MGLVHLQAKSESAVGTSVALPTFWWSHHLSLGAFPLPAVGSVPFLPSWALQAWQTAPGSAIGALRFLCVESCWKILTTEEQS